jgi:chromosome segregation ATPase
MKNDLLKKILIYIVVCSIGFVIAFILRGCEIRDLRRTVTEFNRTHKIAEGRIKFITNKLINSQSYISGLERNYTALRENNTRFEKSIADLQRNNAELRGNNREVIQRIDGSLDRIDSLGNRLREFEDIISEIQDAEP